MPTNRTPIDRGLHVPITPAALEAFWNMKRLARACTCDLDPACEKCDACREWSEWHHLLRSEVRARIWEFPCVIEPEDDVDDHAGNGSEKPGAVWARLARERYRILDAALRAARG
jgi:hypothetical protein